LRLLGEQFGFQVEMKESLLSKVLVLMPLITATIGEHESRAMFVARIKNATNPLVGNYNIVEHKAYERI
jgi:hypothetical protein